MIEVEKKFQPTDEQKEKLLEKAVSISDKEVIDIYYDTPTFEFVKKNMWLRNRDNNWELKTYVPSLVDENVAMETKDTREILQILGYEKYNEFSNFLSSELKILGKIITKRQQYKREGFILDFDSTDFGLKMLEIELSIEDENLAEEAKRKILDFANNFDLKEIKMPIKPALYLKEMKPEIYNEIFRKNEKSNEFKMK